MKLVPTFRANGTFNLYHVLVNNIYYYYLTKKTDAQNCHLDFPE